MSDDEAREAATRVILGAFHTLHPRIPGIEKGDCHCNLLAEVALDAVVPVLLAAGRRQAAEEIAAAIKAAMPSTRHFWDTADAARVYALNDAAKIAARIAEAAPAEPVEEATRPVADRLGDTWASPVTVTGFDTEEDTDAHTS